MMKRTVRAGLLTWISLLILFSIFVFPKVRDLLLYQNISLVMHSTTGHGNCCNEICELDVLAPSQLPYNKCPEEYLIFSPYAGFNNKLVVYIQALLLAARVQRTVIMVDEWLDSSRSWRTSLDHENVCVKFMTSEQVTALIADSKQPVRSVYWGVPLCPAQLADFEMHRIQLDGDFFNRYRHNVHYFSKYPEIGCVADHMPTMFQHSAVMFMPCPYFLSVDKQSYVNALKHIKISRKISEIGDAIIRKLFGNAPFVGVHLRNFEGECQHAVNAIYSEVDIAKPFLNEAKNTCNMSWTFIQQQFRSKSGIDIESTPVFLSSDNQLEEATRDLVNHANVAMLDNDILQKEYPEVDILLLDMYILTKSSAFLGNPYSSLSFHVLLWREINGFNPATNIQPAYSDIGMLYHLFK